MILEVMVVVFRKGGRVGGGGGGEREGGGLTVGVMAGRGMGESGGWEVAGRQ